MPRKRRHAWLKARVTHRKTAKRGSSAASKLANAETKLARATTALASAERKLASSMAKKRKSGRRKVRRQVASMAYAPVIKAARKKRRKSVARRVQRAGYRFRRKASSQLSSQAKTVLWGIAGAAVTGYLQGAKAADGQLLATKVPQIPFVGPEGTLAAVLYGAGWAFKWPVLRKMATGPAVIAGYKVFRGVAKGLETGSLGLSVEVPASMLAAGEDGADI